MFSFNFKKKEIIPLEKKDDDDYVFVNEPDTFDTGNLHNTVHDDVHHNTLDDLNLQDLC